MSKVAVVYWSGTGNTKAMAEAIGEGVVEAGAEAVVLDVSKVSVADLKQATVFAMGCPSMGAEELEDSEMEPFVSEVEGFAAGKKIALFGSYGWGDGQWMEEWESTCSEASANLVCQSVICNDYPDEEALDACYHLGQSLVK